MMPQACENQTERAELPTEIIARFTQEAPVDVHTLAHALGLMVSITKLDPNISGKIERDHANDSYLISVNASHGQRRQRFTLAHEIAHFVLHRDLIGGGIVDDPLYQSKRGEIVERHASDYAGTILMPAPLVRSCFRKVTQSIPEIAERFDVSADVARIRIKELRLVQMECI